MKKSIKNKLDVKVGETQGHKSSKDKDFWQRISDILSENNHSYQHVLSLFPAYVRRLHLMRFFAHYELFKMAVDLPGNFVEIGVFRGSSFFTFHKLLETFCPTDRRRHLFGFEHFKGLNKFHKKDGRKTNSDGKSIGGFDTRSVRDEILKLLDLHNDDNLIPNAKRSFLIEGDVKKTIPDFLKKNPGLRISLLHLDADLYEPTMTTLKNLFPRVVKGGLVVFDEYGLMPWEGESTAADEYFEKINYKPKWKRFKWSTQPQGYFIKE